MSDKIMKSIEKNKNIKTIVNDEWMNEWMDVVVVLVFESELNLDFKFKKRS